MTGLLASAVLFLVKWVIPSIAIGLVLRRLYIAAGI